MRPSHEKKSFQEIARRTLVARSQELIARRDAADQAARGLLDEREPDWEDRAANVTAASSLLQLGESGRAQLLLVQQALQRLDDGSWGWCVNCGGSIDEARLRAAPEASCCAACSSHHA
jgi:RNA polymerase-binding transcription factor DksA